MPYFPSVDDIYRVLQRELPPDDVYPDGAPSAFFSTSENYAVASVFDGAYQAASGVYFNYFPLTCDIRQPDFETTYFGAPLDASIPASTRLIQLMAKIRYQPAPTLWNILTLALTYVPVGTIVGIVPYYADQPFNYQVRIYETSISAAQTALLQAALEYAGPARSEFDIAQNVNRATYNLNWYVDNADNTSLVQNAYVDPSSSTGYTGVTDSNNQQGLYLTDQQGNLLTDQDGNYIITQSATSDIVDQSGNQIQTQGGDTIETQT